MGREEHITVWEGKYLRVRICGRWEYAERTKARAGVVIVAVTAANKLLLTEQYRVPMQKNVIEFPAGLAGDEADSNEEFVSAAHRELREETGYEAPDWQQLAGGPASAGLSNEIVIFFRACNLQRVAHGGGGDAEDIRVHEVPLDQVERWLEQKERDGLAVDPKVYAGLYFLARENRGVENLFPKVR